MSRQRTGSHFQRQSNIAEPIGIALDRPLNNGTCAPCLGSFYLAPGHLLQRVTYTASASGHPEPWHISGNCSRRKRPQYQAVIAETRHQLHMQILEHYQEKTVFYRTEPGDHESPPAGTRRRNMLL